MKFIQGMLPASRPSSRPKGSSTRAPAGSGLIPLATAVVVAAGATAASGQIVSYTINQAFDTSNTGSLYLTPTTGALYTDGAHSSDDLTFTWTGQSLQITSTGSPQVLITSDNTTGNLKTYVTPLSAGATIGPDSPTSGTVAVAYGSGSGATLKSYSAPNDTWNGNTTQYAGFETNPTGSLEQYGWLQIQSVQTIDPGGGFTTYGYNVIDGALQLDGSAITAGETSAVPELPVTGLAAGSLALLAGSAAMLRRRRELIATA